MMHNCPVLHWSQIHFVVLTLQSKRRGWFSRKIRTGSRFAALHDGVAIADPAINYITKVSNYFIANCPLAFFTNCSLVLIKIIIYQR